MYKYFNNNTIYQEGICCSAVPLYNNYHRKIDITKTNVFFLGQMHTLAQIVFQLEQYKINFQTGLITIAIEKTKRTVFNGTARYILGAPAVQYVAFINYNMYCVQSRINGGEEVRVQDCMGPRLENPRKTRAHKKIYLILYLRLPIVTRNHQSR